MRGGRARAALLVALAAMITCAGVAAAHAGLGAASPAPGATVGGEITEIQLRYASTVVDVTGSVTDPAGAVIDTEFVQTSALAVTIELASPLDVPGEHAVRHSSTSVDDGDRVDAAYLFTYDPAAPPPQLEILEPDDGGVSPWVGVVLALGLVGIGVLVVRLVRSLWRLRAARSSG
ncbi:MAG: hypothetical protein HKN44_15180 [Ilumatobacter sp.]|nr:hypothetical protein [Ilumatobacter sp.]